MDIPFLARIDQLREDYGKPLIVTSAYRCPSHNSSVSSTGTTGPHTTGCAIDFLIAGADAHALLEVAVEQGFPGIGINQKGDWEQRFLHVDDLTENRPRIWSY